MACTSPTSNPELQGLSPSGPTASSPPPSSPPPISISKDSFDDEWEDEDIGSDTEHLPGLGVTSHRTRNPQYPVIPIQKRAKRPRGPNARATARLRREVTAKNSRALAADIKDLNAEREARAVELAETQYQAQRGSPPNQV
ncbi:hypothetical protein C8J57DRAFT_1542245 [Mycena rebaudengoi]|nr:hypothetical protein C8J57DRAFT_1542245 [Mycena rebaudengoi]